MRKAKGYVRGGPGEEADLVSCGHCTGHLQVTPGLSGVSASCPFCRCCMRFICTGCDERRVVHGCVVWERMIEASESRGRLHKSLGV